jgi:hypothetical protein
MRKTCAQDVQLALAEAKIDVKSIVASTEGNQLDEHSSSI